MCVSGADAPEDPYAHETAAQYVFGRLVREGRQAELLSLPETFNTELHAWLLRQACSRTCSLRLLAALFCMHAIYLIQSAPSKPADCHALQCDCEVYQLIMLLETPALELASGGPLALTHQLRGRWLSTHSCRDNLLRISCCSQAMGMFMKF